jgi:hypothetical protein
MQNLKRKITNIATIALGIISVDSYRRSINTSNAESKIEILQKQLLETKETANRLDNSLLQNLETDAENQELVKKSLEHVDAIAKNAGINSNLQTEELLNNLSESDKLNYLSKIRESTEDSQKHLDALNDILKEILGKSSGSKGSTQSGFIDMNSSTDYYHQIQSLIDNLSLTQKGALANILFSIVCLYSFISIIGVLFGDYLLDYFKLEQKFPRLAKYFTIRKKLKRYFLL